MKSAPVLAPESDVVEESLPLLSSSEETDCGAIERCSSETIFSNREILIAAVVRCSVESLRFVTVAELPRGRRDRLTVVQTKPACWHDEHGEVLSQRRLRRVHCSQASTVWAVLMAAFRPLFFEVPLFVLGPIKEEKSRCYTMFLCEQDIGDFCSYPLSTHPSPLLTILFRER